MEKDRNQETNEISALSDEDLEVLTEEALLQYNIAEQTLLLLAKEQDYRKNNIIRGQE